MRANLALHCGIEKALRRPPVVLAMAGITILALIVAVALILFQVNPQQDATQRGVNRQSRELSKQVREINMIICSQAQTTANAYRFRSLTPSGRVEPIRHFLTRMQAQRQTLELSQGRDCPVAPGFPPFEFQLKRALEQIERILASFSAEQRKPVDRGVSHETPNPSKSIQGFGVPFLPTLPGNGENFPGGGKAGIGEDGVPYLPPKGSKHHHPPNITPQAPGSTPVEREREPRSAPLVQAPEGSEPSSEGTEGEESPSLAQVAAEAVEGTEEVPCSAIREVHHLC